MTEQEFSEIEFIELKRRLDGDERILIVDVRNPDEFVGENGHIPGARKVPFADMPLALERIVDAIDRTIAANCGFAGRSESAAQLMSEAGFRHISVIRGGLVAWREAGFPTD